MIERLRRAFNDTWNESAYEALKARLVAEAGCPITFRVCETPVFLPAELREAMVAGAGEIWAELLRPDRLEFSKAAVPPGFDVPGSDAHPLFAQADFAIATDHGRLVPRLIELQGFPSLYGFQFVQNRILRDRLRPRRGPRVPFLRSGRGRVPCDGGGGDPGRAARGARRAPRSRSAAPGHLSGLHGHREAVRGASHRSRTRSRSAAGSSGTSATGRRLASCASTTASSWTSWSPRGSPCPSTFARSWTCSGPGIRTGSSGGASIRCRGSATRSCPRPGCSPISTVSRATSRTGC